MNKACKTAVLALTALLLAGCWEAQGNWLDDGGLYDGGAETPDTGDEPWEVSCTDLSPCVSSDISGFTCPGRPNTVKCWDLSSHCSAPTLCASIEQACSIACNSASCGQSGSSPPKPQCN